MIRSDFYVYVWLDPNRPGKFIYEEYKFEYEPFYIGKGARKRSNSVLRKYNRLIYSRIKKIKNPIIIKLKTEMTEQESFTLEKMLIKLIGRVVNGNGPLLNLTDGGEGISGMIMSEETKEKISKANKGKSKPPTSDETKIKIAEALTGKKRTDITKQRLREAKLGKPRSEATKKKLSVAKLGKPGHPHTKESKRKIAEANRGKPKNEEHVRKSVESKKINKSRKKLINVLKNIINVCFDGELNIKPKINKLPF